MHSKKEDLVEDHMGKEKARLYREQEDNIEENIITKRDSWS